MWFIHRCLQYDVISFRDSLLEGIFSVSHFMILKLPEEFSDMLQYFEFLRMNCVMCHHKIMAIPPLLPVGEI